HPASRCRPPGPPDGGHEGAARRRGLRPRAVGIDAVALPAGWRPIGLALGRRPPGGYDRDMDRDPDRRLDSRSLAILEFPQIRARLAEHTEFAPSRRLAEALEPSSDPLVVARGLDETDEARAFLEQRPGVGVAGARDIGAAVARAERGGRLETEALQEVLDTLIAAGRLADSLQGARGPLLRGLGREIAPLPALRATLERSLDPAGGLLDSASPRLGGLRRAVRVAYDRLRSRLEQLVHSSEISPALQEPLITLRNGRYVV